MKTQGLYPQKPTCRMSDHALYKHFPTIPKFFRYKYWHILKDLDKEQRSISDIFGNSTLCKKYGEEFALYIKNNPEYYAKLHSYRYSQLKRFLQGKLIEIAREAKKNKSIDEIFSNLILETYGEEFAEFVKIVEKGNKNRDNFKKEVRSLHKKYRRPNEITQFILDFERIKCAYQIYP